MENIIENNKLIAEFVGYEFINDTLQYEVTEENYLLDFMVIIYKFHRSWDWLIPVIFKIIDDKNIYTQERQVILNSKCSDISIAYNKVVEVINRLNQTVNDNNIKQSR